MLDYNLLKKFIESLQKMKTLSFELPITHNNQTWVVTFRLIKNG